MKAQVESSNPCCGKEQRIKMDLETIEAIRWIPENWHCVEGMPAYKIMKAGLGMTI